MSTESVEPSPDAEAQSPAPAYGSHPVNYGTYVVAEPAEPIVAVPMPAAEPPAETPVPAEEIPAGEGDHTREGA